MLVFKLLLLNLAYSANSYEDGNFVVNLPPTTSPPRPILPSYKIYTDRLNWTSARDACVSEGQGRMAVIDTPEKLEHVRSIRPWRNWVWTGIYRESATSDWRTVHGDPISPNLPQLHYAPYIFGNCVAISGLESTTRLSVMPCDEARRYVCEMPDAQ